MKSHFKIEETVTYHSQECLVVGCGKFTDKVFLYTEGRSHKPKYRVRACSLKCAQKYFTQVKRQGGNN